MAVRQWVFVLVVAASYDSNEDSTVAIRKGSNTELQQLLTLLDLMCKLTNLQWNKDLVKIIHQCKEVVKRLLTLERHGQASLYVDRKVTNAYLYARRQDLEY